MGGDHPRNPAFSRAHRGEVGYIHLDAHPDLGDEFEGSPLSHACVSRRVLECPGFPPARCVLLGVRSLLPHELEYLAAHPGVKVIPAGEMAAQRVEAIAEAAVDSLSGADAVYISLGIDVLDPACAPGTGTPEAGGFLSGELIPLLRRLVEVSPPLDTSDITAFAALAAEGPGNPMD